MGGEREEEGGRYSRVIFYWVFAIFVACKEILGLGVC